MAHEPGAPRPQAADAPLSRLPLLFFETVLWLASSLLCLFPLPTCYYLRLVLILFSPLPATTCYHPRWVLVFLRLLFESFLSLYLLPGSTLFPYFPYFPFWFRPVFFLSLSFVPPPLFFVPPPSLLATLPMV